MANDISKLSEAERAQARAESDARMKAIMLEGLPAEKARFAALVKARNQRFAVEKTAAEAREREREAAEVAKKKSDILQTSRGGSTLPVRQQIASAQTSDEAKSEIEDAELSDDVLGNWQPRKERIASSSREQSRELRSSGTEKKPASKHSAAEKPSATASMANNNASVRTSTDQNSINKGTAASQKPFNVPVGKPIAPAPINTNVAVAQSSKPTDTTSPPLQSTSGPAKRPTPSAFTDDRRDPVPKMPKLSEAASPQSPNGPFSGQDPKKRSTSKAARPSLTVLSIDERPPAWYKELTLGQQPRKPEEANASGLLGRLKDDIKKCKGGLKGAQAQQRFQAIREELHTLAFERVSPQLLRRNRMLHDQDGLRQIFDEAFADGVVFSWDIKADAEELYNKWCLQMFETDLLRGIIPGKPASKNVEKKVDSLDEAYKGRASSKFHGNGLLLNGQWWPTQLTAVRDGAHGATIAGISGAVGEGAYSCIMSGGHEYPDEDHGEWVLYCGTDSKDGSITEGTLRLLESERNGKPVRLLRSHNLVSSFAPEIGFRYDGLYKVVSHENLDGSDSTRQRHRFRLERLPGQDPIRGREPEKRPTRQEIEAHKKDKRLRGFT